MIKILFNEQVIAPLCSFHPYIITFIYIYSIIAFVLYIYIYIYPDIQSFYPAYANIVCPIFVLTFGKSNNVSSRSSLFLALLRNLKTSNNCSGHFKLFRILKISTYLKNPDDETACFNISRDLVNKKKHKLNFQSMHTLK